MQTGDIPLRVSVSVLTTVAVLLSGCATPYSKESIETAVRGAKDTEASLAPKEWVTGADAQTVKVGWLDSFDDPALVKLVEEALANNRNLQAAAAGLERAQALAQKAGAALSPSVDLTTGGARAGSGNDEIPDTTELNVGVRVGWEPDLWGRIRAGAGSAKADAQAVASDYRYARESLAAATTKAYIAAVTAQIQTSIAGDTVTILEEMLRIVSAKKAVEAVSAQDVAVVRSDLARARAGLASAEGSQRDALRALEILLGRYPAADVEVQQKLPTLPTPPPSGLPSELLERRPDLIAAERRVAASFNAVAAAKAARLPRLSLTGNAGGASPKLRDILNPEQLAWQLGASLLTPLVDGGSRKADERVATAQQKEALASYGQAVLEAFSEVETLLDQGTVFSQRATDLGEAMEQAKKAFRIAKLGHDEGELELLDTLSVQQRLSTAEADFLNAHRLLLDQRVDLFLALGGSWGE